MASIQVTLPETATQFVEGQVAAGQFANASEYLTFLVEEARATSAKRRLDDLLDEGTASGPPIEFTPEWWFSRKAQLLATLPAEQSE
jgi:antitoxin ParD1/3/4